MKFDVYLFVGLAQLASTTNSITPFATTSYTAPEMIKHKQSSMPSHNYALDAWSLGVILYTCLCGFPPFNANLTQDGQTYTMREQILHGLFKFRSPHWDKV